ncbi:MAG: paraquat-inducible protein A [Neisseriaceae bacterium]|nr:paraquat-inducible protein A [Neisseriaceae bacterium]
MLNGIYATMFSGSLKNYFVRINRFFHEITAHHYDGSVSCVLGCRICDTENHVHLKNGEEALCVCCGHRLMRIESDPYRLPVLYSLVALLLILPVTLNFFLGMHMPGAAAYLTLPAMMYSLLFRDYGFLANTMFFFVFSTPLIFLGLLLYVYGALWTQTDRPFLITATHWLFRLKSWLMVDIFAVASLVALVKIRAVSSVDFGLAFFLLPVLALLLARISLSLSPPWIYRRVARIRQVRVQTQANGENHHTCMYCSFRQPEHLTHCMACHRRLSPRRPHSLQLSLAFLVAAIVFYLPSNILPIMITENPTAVIVSRILDGVFTLWNQGDHFIAVIIFTASVAIPFFKIVGMIVLLWAARFKHPFSIPFLSHLYRIIEIIGRWSMIDVFVIIMLMATFATPVARVTPGAAVIYFTAVVLLMMLSAYFFDVRLLWEQHDKSNN